VAGGGGSGERFTPLRLTFLTVSSE
jgi:hypothetical protein